MITTVHLLSFEATVHKPVYCIVLDNNRLCNNFHTNIPSRALSIRIDNTQIEASQHLHIHTRAPHQITTITRDFLLVITVLVNSLLVHALCETSFYCISSPFCYSVVAVVVIVLYIINNNG